MAQFVTRVDDDTAVEVVAVCRGRPRARSWRPCALASRPCWSTTACGRIGRSIVEGYTRTPQTESDVGWADDATRRMIADESWVQLRRAG